MFIEVRKRLHHALTDETGATIAEYGILIAGLIAVGGVIMSTYAVQLQDVVKSIGESFKSFPDDVTKDMK